MGIIRGVLPASQTTNRPNQLLFENRASLIGAILLGLYALVVGLGLRGGWIGADRAYLWMMVPCIVMALWYAYGFLKVADREQDFGLLLSAVGWSLVALGLLIKDSAARALFNRPDAALTGEPDSPAATICFGLALLCLAAGAMMSWAAWHRENR